MSFRSTVLALCCLIATTLAGSAWAEQEEGDAEFAEPVWVTSISPLGSSRFVAATADGLLLREADVCTFSPSDPSKLTPIYQHPAAVWCVDATSDGGKVASVDYKGNLIVFDTVTSTETLYEKAFERWCQAMMIVPSGTSVVAGNEAGKIMSFDLISGKVIKSVELDGDSVTGLAMSPDQATLAASDGGGHVHLLTWPELEPIGKIEVSDDTAWCVAFVDDGRKLLVGSGDRNLYECDAKPGAKAKSIVRGSDWITRLAVSDDGLVAAAEVGGRLHFPGSGRNVSMDAASGVWALCWRGESALFAGTRKDGIVIARRSWTWSEPEPEPVAEEPAEANDEEMTEDAPAEDAADASEPAEPSDESKEDAAEEKDSDEEDSDDKEENNKEDDDKEEDAEQEDDD